METVSWPGGVAAQRRRLSLDLHSCTAQANGRGLEAGTAIDSCRSARRLPNVPSPLRYGPVDLVERPERLSRTALTVALPLHVEGVASPDSSSTGCLPAQARTASARPRRQGSGLEDVGLRSSSRKAAQLVEGLGGKQRRQPCRRRADSVLAGAFVAVHRPLPGRFRHNEDSLRRCPDGPRAAGAVEALAA